MPKESYILNRFEGGLNNNSDPRDIEDNEFSLVENFRVDVIGKLIAVGDTVAVTDTLNDSSKGEADIDDITVSRGGFGLFLFRHSRTGANNPASSLVGHHTGGDHSTIMTNSDAKFRADSLIGATIENTTDGSSGTISDNDGTTVTVLALSGGTDDSWDDPGDEIITDAKNRDFSSASDWVRYHPSTTIALGDDGSPAYLEITGTSGTAKEGVELGTSYLEDISDTVTYRVSASIWAASGTIDNFKIELGGVATEPFSISTSTTAITKDITASGDAALRIYYEDASTTQWNVDNVSVKPLDYYKVTALPETGADYVVYSDMYNAKHECRIYSKQDNGEGWTDISVLKTGSGTNTSYPVFYYVNDAVRVCDGNFENETSTNKWLGYIETKLFTGTGSPYEWIHNSWYEADQEIAAPANNNCAALQTWDTDPDHGDPLASGTVIGGTDRCLILIEQVGGGTEFPGTGWGGSTVGSASTGNNGDAAGTGVKEFEFATSFEYDRRGEFYQESPLQIHSTKIDLSGQENDDSVKISCYIDSQWAKDWNPRITGINIYMKEPIDEVFYHQAHVSIAKGIKSSAGGVRQAWTKVSNETWLKCITDRIVSPLKDISFQSHAGFEEDVLSLNARYKTAVVANGRNWIGNIQYTDYDGSTKVSSDGMIMTPDSAYDSFPASGFIEVIGFDGDPIIKLEDYGDRLLQFREHNLHILNISDPANAFVENTHAFMGVAIPAAVCKTDFGVAWANSFGVYFYNGSDITNLFEKDGVKKIKIKTTGDSDSWEDDYHESAQVQFVPDLRQLFVMCRSTSGAVTKVYVYDFGLSAWTKLSETIRNSTQTATNMIHNPYNNRIMFARYDSSGTPTTNFFEWNHSATSGNADMKFATKDIDFGMPSSKKTVYNVKISYKGDADGISVGYLVNGDDDFNDVLQFNSDSTPLADKSSTENLESWHQLELTPTSRSQAKDIYSIRLYFTQSTIASSFEINDITFVYRAKASR